MPTSVLSPADFNVANGVPQLDSSGNLQAVVIQKHDTTTNLASITGPAWSLAVDTTTKQVKLLDGSTGGGIALNPMADIFDVITVTSSTNWDDDNEKILQESTAPVVVVYFDLAGFSSYTATIDNFNDGAFVGQRLILIPYNSASATSYVCNLNTGNISPGRILVSGQIKLNGGIGDNNFVEFIWRRLANGLGASWMQVSGGGDGDPIKDLSRVKKWNTINSSTTSTQNTGTTEATLNSVAISNTAGTGAFNGSQNTRIIAQYSGTFVQSATATRQVKLILGGTTVFDSGALPSTLANAYWSIRAKIYRKSATEVKCLTELVGNNITIPNPVGYVDVTGLDFTSATTLDLTGTAAGTGAASGDIVLQISDMEAR